MTNPKPFFIVGAGGQGRETLDVVDAINSVDPRWEFLGFVSDTEPNARVLERLGASWLGNIEQAKSFARASFSVGVGSGVDRIRIANELRGVHDLVSLVHPNATFGRHVRFGEGITICSHVSVTTNIDIGDLALINRNSTVGHDCVLGEAATVNPGVNISGNVTISDHVTIGTGASIIQGLNIGVGAVIGAGAAVVGDVGAGSTVVGVPARAI